jgi:hypothetical protein
MQTYNVEIKHDGMPVLIFNFLSKKKAMDFKHDCEHRLYYQSIKLCISISVVENEKLVGVIGATSPLVAFKV